MSLMFQRLIQMKQVGQLVCIGAAVVLVAGIAARAGSAQEQMRDAGIKKAEQAIASWKPAPKDAAEKMIKKYGQPAEVTSMRLVWHDNGPWKFTEVMNKEIEHNFPIPHKDAMHQAVSYRIDPDDAGDILKFDGSVILNRTAGMLGAICDKEPANLLAVNLAHEVASGKRSVDDARKQYAQSIALLMKGSMDKYVSGLLFDPPANAGFADEPFGPVGTSGKN